MRFLTVAALLGATVAYPGMKGPKKDHSGVFRAIIERAGERLYEERKRLVERQAPPAQPVILLGDLQPAGQGGTPTNDRIVNCFNSANGASCTSTEQYTPPTRDTPQCAADTCCIWSYIKDALVPLMRNADGTCNDFARNAVRFGFHDAGAWDLTQTRGGADGSLLLEQTEVTRPENFGLELSRNILLPIFLEFRSYGISAADLVQFAHNVAVVVCPLGPRSLTYVGRPDWAVGDQTNPTGLLPDATSPADVLLDLFLDKSIGTQDLVALIGAHTTAKQFFFDPSQAGLPLDTTPGVWDVAFYAEVLNGTTPCGTFRLPSDNAMAAAPGPRNGFVAMSAGFPLDTGAGQVLWNGLYSRGYLRLSLLGVQNIQGLTDCSKALPNEIPVFEKPPSAIVTCDASSSSSSIFSSATSSVASSSSSFVSASSTASTLSSSIVSSSSADVSSSSAPASSSSSSFVANDVSSSSVPAVSSSSASGPVLPASSSSAPALSSSSFSNPLPSASSSSSLSSALSRFPNATVSQPTVAPSSSRIANGGGSSLPSNSVPTLPNPTSSRPGNDPRPSSSTRSNGGNDPRPSSSTRGNGGNDPRPSSSTRGNGGNDPRPTSSTRGSGGPGGPGGPGNGGNNSRPTSSTRGGQGGPGGPGNGGNDPRPTTTRGGHGGPGGPGNGGNDPRPTTTRRPGQGGDDGGNGGNNGPRTTSSSRLANNVPGGGSSGSAPSSKTTTISVTRTTTITRGNGRVETSTVVDRVTTVVPVDAAVTESVCAPTATREVKVLVTTTVYR